MSRPTNAKPHGGYRGVDRMHNISLSHSSFANDPAQQLLGRLEGVIKTGKGWRARCPVHGGKSASLSIAEGDNGTLLLHCFAGCAVHDVLVAVGLEVGDLFPRRDLKSMSRAERSQFQQASLLPRWRAALEVLNTEANVVLIAAGQLADNHPLKDADLTRARVACLRIFDAREVLNAR
jgi:hypothetical protein